MEWTEKSKIIIRSNQLHMNHSPKEVEYNNTIEIRRYREISIVSKNVAADKYNPRQVAQ